MANASIRAVFLDAGKTLFHEREDRAAVYARFAMDAGGSAETESSRTAMELAFQELPHSIDGHFRFSLSWFRAFNQKVLAELQVPPPSMGKAQQRLLDHFQNPASYQLYPEVLDVLSQLHQLGLVTGIVSNWSEHLPELCRHLGIADHVHFIVASAELRAEKPDRAIFERALFRGGVPAEQTLHVGNNLEMDVRGALGAGLRAALLDREGVANGSTPDGVPVVADLSALLPLVDQPAHVEP
ncbi:MAG: HAD family hydrolase [Planctomycetota bacterium]|nr:MAG: HAD family hydrolase [Planctomycetota bacterium]